MTAKWPREDLIAGDQRSFSATAYDATGAVKSLNGALAATWYLVSATDINATPVITKTLGSGVEIVSGKAVATVSRSDSLSITPGLYEQQFKVTDADGTPATIGYGPVLIKRTAG